MTKKEIINEIAGVLKYTRREAVIKEYEELRQPNRGYHAYCIRYDETADTALVYPWSGARKGWEIPVKNITKKRLEEIRDRLIFSVEL